MALEVIWRNPIPPVQSVTDVSLAHREQGESIYLVYRANSMVVFQINHERIHRLLAKRKVHEVYKTWHTKVQHLQMPSPAPGWQR